MTEAPRDPADDVIERYREAGRDERASPSAAARAAILAEGRRIAAERARSPDAAIDTRRPAANDSRWKLVAGGSIGVAVLAALVMLPHLRTTSPAVIAANRESQAQSAAISSAPAAPRTAPPQAFPDSLPQAPSVAPEHRRRLPMLADDGAANRSTANAGTGASAEPPLAASRQAAPPSASAEAVPPRFADQSAATAGAAPPTASASLLAAVTAGDLSEATHLLEQRAANPNVTDTAGRTPLALAVQSQRADLVQLLLAHGADPNVADYAGETPLHAAQRTHAREIAAALEAAGAR